MLSRHTTELPSQPLCYDCFLHFGTGSHKLVLEPTCGPRKPLTLDPAASVSTQLGCRAYATRPSLALVFWKCLCLYSVSACYWFQREGFLLPFSAKLGKTFECLLVFAGLAFFPCLGDSDFLFGPHIDCRFIYLLL